VRAYAQAVAKETAVHSYGTAVVFARRAEQYKNWLRWIDFVGLCGPLLVGGLMMAGQSIPGLTTVASFAAVAQSVFFLWALTSRWEDKLEAAIDGKRANRELAEAYFESMANKPSDEMWQVLEVKRQAQDASDYKYPPSEYEKRYGMRQALYQYRFACGNADCKKTPASLAPTDCPTCGSFPVNWVK
jgi:mobilome CxxCx(11)CxxC protein